MCKTKSTVQWGNEMFTVSSEIGCEPSYQGIYLTDVYSRPSTKKRIIDTYWRDWLRANDDGNGWIGISSHNSNFFTMCGTITKDNTLYGFKIYPTRNVAWIIRKEV